MRVYKFGGASVKDAAGVKNVFSILNASVAEPLVIVVSAMGKTTNALENVVQHYHKGESWDAALDSIADEHTTICRALFPENHPIFRRIGEYRKWITDFLTDTREEHPSYIYDQIISVGELLSSTILSAYFTLHQLENEWLDARQYIITDENFREGNVQWDATEQKIKTLQPKLYVTQGFLGGTAGGQTTTLGREGSDYTAAIFAYCLNAESVTIWKDVPGVMTADPRRFSEARVLEDISYEEAIEMAYYGASVIHPKTLQPLKQKHIPFYVKSFVEPHQKGTIVRAAAEQSYPTIFIYKEHLSLLKLFSKDFSFIAEEHLTWIFHHLTKEKIKVAMMQNSAISLSLILEDKYKNEDRLVETLSRNFKIERIQDVSLFTVRHAKDQSYDHYLKPREILLQQTMNNTIQMVSK